VTDNFEIAAGGNNILDTMADPTEENAGVRFITDGVINVEGTPMGPRAVASFGNVKYPFRAVPFGLNGGFYYIRANYSFDHF